MNRKFRERLERLVEALQTDGATNPVTLIDQVCNLIYLKIIDEEERNTNSNDEKTQGKRFKSGSLFVGQAKRYLWSEWSRKRDEDLLAFLKNDVFPYMASLDREDPQIANYFREIQLKIHDPMLLNKVVSVIDSINFSKLEINVKSETVEYLLSHFVSPDKFEQYRTPPQIRHLMVEMVAPDFGETIFDPACGTGGFLIDSVRYVFAKHQITKRNVPVSRTTSIEKQRESIGEVAKEIPRRQILHSEFSDRISNWKIFENSFYCADVSRAMMRITMTNLMLHGIRCANIRRADSTTTVEGVNGTLFSREFNVILSYPTIGGLDQASGSKSKRVLAKSGNTELIFLKCMMKSLAPGGRCAVIVPDYLLYRSTASYSNLRRRLIENYNVLAVISLPVNTYWKQTVSKRSVIVFCRPTESAQLTAVSIKNEMIWFFEMRAVVPKWDKFTSNKCKSNSYENDIPELLASWKIYKESGFKEPLGVEGEAILTDNSSEQRCWWTTTRRIAENNFNLMASRYRPLFLENYCEHNSTELIRETLTIQRDITTGLEQLLQKVEES